MKPSSRARSTPAPRSDRDLGIRTQRAELLEGLQIDSENRIHGNRYEPTPFGVVDDMLCGLGLDCSRFVFVDLGSGKGRVLALAARHPFRQIIGVEFSRELHAIALSNIALMSADRGRTRHIRSIHADAADYEFPREPLVVFLFNPFAAPVVARVLENLERSHRATGEACYVLYYMPVAESVLNRATWLRPHSAARDWVIYCAEGISSPEQR
jgi:SAM-dependent methyltransferase